MRCIPRRAVTLAPGLHPVAKLLPAHLAGVPRLCRGPVDGGLGDLELAEELAAPPHLELDADVADAQRVLYLQFDRVRCHFEQPKRPLQRPLQWRGSGMSHPAGTRPFIHMLAAVASATLSGAVGRAVSVEVHVSNGLPGFTIVGLPDAAVREARDRVRAAVLSSGLPWPLRRVTVNLAPSGIRKGGAGLDLPIAVGLLVAAGELSPTCTEGLAFCGELGLNGSLRHVPGMIALADAASTPLGLVVPLCDVREAALVPRKGRSRRGHPGRFGARTSRRGSLAHHTAAGGSSR